MSDTASVVPLRPVARPAESALEIADLKLIHENKVLLDISDARVSKDGVTCLIGPNGAGKSLFLRAIMGLIATNSGHIRISPRFKDPALVFQRPVLLRRSVRGNLSHALKMARVPRNERAGRLAELLVAADLTRLAENPARALSGGEQQRLAIARALASQPRMILLDEPTASLDPAATKSIEDLIQKTKESGVKVVIVTHDRAQAQRLSDDVLFLHKGQVLEQSPTATFFSGPSSDAASAYLSGQLLL